MSSTQSASHGLTDTAEGRRLAETHAGIADWKRWGPYLAERSWGTPRENYTTDESKKDYEDRKDAWSYFTHDDAPARAYRWIEDGLAGISDEKQVLCFALALWNGKDPDLKERLFGVTNTQGSHGEDVKEYYFYLDSTPTHSYMKFLYKYPHAEFPTGRLLKENEGRGKNAPEDKPLDRGTPEFELLDTGVFDEDRYFDIFVEYAKADAEDICVRVEAFNRGPVDAPLHILPHLWFRNTWSWTQEAWGPDAKPEPVICMGPRGDHWLSLRASDEAAEPAPELPPGYKLGTRYFYGPSEGAEDPAQLFTYNETDNPAIWKDKAARIRKPYVKDGIGRYVTRGEPKVDQKQQVGTKACHHYKLSVPAGGSVVLRLRLAKRVLESPLEEVDEIVASRRAEADEFYGRIIPQHLSPDERSVMRQAFAGLLWSKLFYHFDVEKWLNGDTPLKGQRETEAAGINPLTGEQQKRVPNAGWGHIRNADILSVPDKWEFPFYCAWDMAFHAVALALVDLDFAKEQLSLLLSERYMHPNGQLPAHEWDFSKVNPPVHAWAVWQVYLTEKEREGGGDLEFLRRAFHKLLLNFGWWVNRKDAEGKNIFEGGFLGLDNISVFDRDRPFVRGGWLEQADATSLAAKLLYERGRAAEGAIVKRLVEEASGVGESGSVTTALKERIWLLSEP